MCCYVFSVCSCFDSLKYRKCSLRHRFGNSSLDICNVLVGMVYVAVNAYDIEKSDFGNSSFENNGGAFRSPSCKLKSFYFILFIYFFFSYNMTWDEPV